MSAKLSLPSPTATGFVLLSLLVGGCASEQALLTQTQPLQARIDRVEQTLSSSNEAGLRAAEASAERLSARQHALEQQLADVQTGIARLQNQFDARELQTADLLSRLANLDEKLMPRLAGMEKQLRETAALAQTTAQQTAGIQTRQERDATLAATMANGLADAERRMAEINRLAQAESRDMSSQTEALQQRQAAAELAGKQANDAANTRLRLAEEKLNTLSGLVQEALALAAKEIFLANGKEAFTVTLTEDKVLYPQNDPNLETNDAAKLNELAANLAKLDQEYHLDIQGHTANNSTDDNNYSLGKARAEVVKRYLHEKQGISISRMSTLSYGANKPLSPPTGNNRRIFIRVLVLK